MRIFLLLLFLCSAFGAFGQKIRVLDKNTLEPVFNVAIYESGSENLVLSDQYGYAVLPDSLETDLLVFRHPTYKRQEFSIPFLKSQDFIAYLEENIMNIDEVVISANKWEQDKSEVPNEIVTISSKDVGFRNPQTSADLLESTGQVFVQKSQLGGGSPMIRGFAANSVVIMMDGVRMNNAIYRSGNLQNVIMIDPNLLDRTEVIFGPSSVLYGSDALGGVMNFNTVDILPLSSRSGVFTKAFTRYASANNEKTGHLTVRYRKGKWGFITGLTHSNFEDLRSGSNRDNRYPDFGKRIEYISRENNNDVIVQNNDQDLQRFSGYNQTNILQKVGYTSKASKLTYGFYFTTSSDVPRYDRLIERTNDTLRHAEWSYGPQDYQMHSLTYSNFKPHKLYDALKIVGAHQNITESRIDRRYQSNDRRTREEKVKTYSLNIDIDKEFDEKTQLFYGGEILHNHVGSKAFSVDILNPQNITAVATRYPDGGSNYRAIALYMSMKRKILSNISVTGGLRYSNVYLKSKFVDRSFYDFPFDEIKLNNDAISGNISVIYAKPKRWKVSALLSSGFRSPNVDDVGKVFDSEPGNVIVPNPDLGPEISYNCELGFTRNVSDILEIEAVGYYSFLNDAIVRRDFTFNGSSTIEYDGIDSNVQALVNVGEAYIYGYSLALRAQLNQYLTLKANVSNSEGEDKTENTPLRHTTPTFGRASITYQVRKLKSEFFINYNGSRSGDDFSPSELNKPHLYTEDGSPAWTTFNIRSSFSFSENIGLTAALENIFDKHYRPYSSGISAAGRNFILALKAQF